VDVELVTVVVRLVVLVVAVEVVVVLVGRSTSRSTAAISPWLTLSMPGRDLTLAVTSSSREEPRTEVSTLSAVMFSRR